MRDQGSARPEQRGSDLQYRLVSRLIHQPQLLRLVAKLLRRKPSLARAARVVAGRNSVAAVFEREASFSSTARAPNLRAGEFVIGMDSGERHRAERALLERILPSRERFRDVSIAESQRGIEMIQASGFKHFDLIDYMVGVAWRTLRIAFGPVGSSIAGSDPRNPEMPSREFIEELRCLGAQLIIGSVAPKSVRDQADARAGGLNLRVHEQLTALEMEWASHRPADRESIQRNAVGMMWVAHPATVQAGALAMQELLGRRAMLTCLSRQAQDLGPQIRSEAFRKQLCTHVLELLRFRPPFPILNRDVPRDTWFSVGRGFPAGFARAGSQITTLVIGAMFDSEAMVNCDADSYVAGRAFKIESDRHLIFGAGARVCIARHHVVEMLVSALAGLLTLPRVRWCDPWYDRIGYRGPTISRMWLRFG